MKTLFKTYLLPILLIFTFFILQDIFFIVNETNKAVIFQFGHAIRTIETPGLNMKIPFIQKKILFEDRILNVNVEAKELTASDGKRIIVDAFLKYKIIDPIKFFQTVFNSLGAELRINKVLESSMRKVIGKIPLNALLSSQRSDLMIKIGDLVGEEVGNFGIKIIDARILKSDLPSENSAAIYNRMQAEREKEAKQIRAEGSEEAKIIRAKADKEVSIILSNAYMESQIIKASADKKASTIYNANYGKDKEFFEFYQSLITYQKSFKENSYFFLPYHSDFLKHFNFQK
ncbi:MAG: protease modulator HflC [Rickettsia sp.]|nr:protease modulator HflC [Rickettsia sp.]